MPLTVSIVTPTKDIVHGEVDQVTAPSVMGEVGILADHLPLLADMYAGPVGLFSGSEVTYYAVSGGFVEVYRNTVTVLAETAERAQDIDIKRARRALQESETKLTTLDINEPEYDEHEERARRARTRIQERIRPPVIPAKAGISTT